MSNSLQWWLFRKLYYLKISTQSNPCFSMTSFQLICDSYQGSSLESLYTSGDKENTKPLRPAQFSVSYPEEAILAFCHRLKQEGLHFRLQGQSLSIGVMNHFLLKIHRWCNSWGGSQLIQGYIWQLRLGFWRRSWSEYIRKTERQIMWCTCEFLSNRFELLWTEIEVMICVQGGEEKKSLCTQCSNTVFLLKGHEHYLYCHFACLRDFQCSIKSRTVSHLMTHGYKKQFRWMTKTVSMYRSDILLKHDTPFVQCQHSVWIKISPEATDSLPAFYSDHPFSDRCVPTSACTMEGEGGGLHTVEQLGDPL